MAVSGGLIALAALVTASASGQAAPAPQAATPAPPAAAAAADWELIVDARRHLTTAFVAFDNGVAVMVRCNGHAYEAAILGLPPAARGPRTRVLGVAFGDQPVTGSTWLIGADRTLVVNDFPAPFARTLRRGGHLRIVVPEGGGDGRNLRYEIELPPSSAAVDQTLTACDRPLVDPRDASLPDVPESGMIAGFEWVQQPRPDYPEPPAYTYGSATISCLSRSDGRLGDCVVESEFPSDGGFGAAAMKGLPRARVRQTDGSGQPVPTAQIVFRVQFQMQ